MDLTFKQITPEYIKSHYGWYPIKKISDEYLPTSALMDRVFLIKGESIIEFDNHFTYESRDIRWMDPEIIRKTTVTMHKIVLADIMDYLDVSIIKTGEEMTSYDIDKSINFMKVLLKIGFKLYTK